MLFIRKLRSMGKRSPDFEKKPRDYYPTIDPSAVGALAPHLRIQTWFIEPCAGAGDLLKTLEQSGSVCVSAFDIAPQSCDVTKMDCLKLTTDRWFEQADCFITNPPFTWVILQPIMDHLISLLPTWLLLPADVIHNVRMAPYMKKCVKVVSIGRMYWQDNKVKGVDNYCWYLFDKDHVGPTEFIGRAIK